MRPKGIGKMFQSSITKRSCDSVWSAKWSGSVNFVVRHLDMEMRLGEGVGDRTSLFIELPLEK